MVVDLEVATIKVQELQRAKTAEAKKKEEEAEAKKQEEAAEAERLKQVRDMRLQAELETAKQKALETVRLQAEKTQ